MRPIYSIKLEIREIVKAIEDEESNESLEVEALELADKLEAHPEASTNDLTYARVTRFLINSIQSGGHRTLEKIMDELDREYKMFDRVDKSEEQKEKIRSLAKEIQNHVLASELDIMITKATLLQIGDTENLEDVLSFLRGDENN